MQSKHPTTYTIALAPVTHLLKEGTEICVLRLRQAGKGALLHLFPLGVISWARVIGGKVLREISYLDSCGGHKVKSGSRVICI